MTAGLPHPDKRMGLSPLVLVAEERTLKGSYVGSSTPLRGVPCIIALFRAGRLHVDQLLTHRLKLEEINEGFDRLREGVGARQVVAFDCGEQRPAVTRPLRRMQSRYQLVIEYRILRLARVSRSELAILSSLVDREGCR